VQPDEFPRIDTTVASVARVYAYALGDERNSYTVDRQAAHAIEEALPGTFALSRNNRRFLERVVEYLAADCGIRQFLDHGSGLPTRNNVHQVAQKTAPGSRVVYVDYDPVVLAHQQDKALLADDNTTAFICEDVRNVEAIFGHPDTRRLISPDEPTAALWISFMHCIPDSGDPAGIIRSTMDRLPSGSYLAVSHLISDDPDVRREITDLLLTLTGGNWGRARERKDIEEFFEGFEFVEPGLVDITTWRPDGRDEEQASKWIEYGGVARKP
jgi:S-adenosyl methyltransferase